MYQTVVRLCNIQKKIFLELRAGAGWIWIGKKNRREVKKNIRFRNKYCGKRCFIVGNGPSLNKKDLSFLGDEYVFTVNQMMRDKRYAMLKSNFHIIADPLYFNLDLSNQYHKKTIELIRKIESEDNRPECFFPIQAKEFIEKLKLKLKINYFYAGCDMYEGYNNQIDFSKSVPGFHTVAQYALMLAIYCGFNEIYLIGCDMTGYREVEEKAYGNYDEDKHCYHLTEDEKKNVLHKGRTCEEYFNGFAHMFSDYRRLAEYAKKRNIRLMNATEGGVLDSLPRIKYESLFNKS